MTAPPDHRNPLDDEPLSEEERDLAARLGRIGPFDGPSPALDAKILAAAHAAAATRSSGRRRLAWLGVPPAVVTGTGVAAAAVLALGLVWQLRPQPGLVESRSEADAGEEVILIAEPASTTAAPRANPPPFPGEVPAVASAGRAQSVAPASAASSDVAKAVAAPASPAVAEERVARAAAMADAAAQATQAAADAEQKREAEAAGHAARDSGFVAEPPASAAPARNGHATYTTAARARPEQRMRTAANTALPPPAPAAAPAAAAPPAAKAASAAAAAEAGAEAGAEAATLDRIEVTGSRIRRDADTDWSQVPISEDAHLAAADWLERIRARRDGDDEDSARASLRLFQREYPRVRLPDDLRELLADAKQ